MLRTLTLICALILGSSMAFANVRPITAQDDEIITHFDATDVSEMLEEILADHEIDVVVEEGEDGEDLWFDLDPWVIKVFSYEDEDEDGDSVMMQATRGKTSADTPESMNEWNWASRFGRMYINSDEDVVRLEDDVDLTGGITKESLRRYLNRFVQTVMDTEVPDGDGDGGGSVEGLVKTFTMDDLRDVATKVDWEVEESEEGDELLTSIGDWEVSIWGYNEESEDDYDSIMLQAKMEAVDWDLEAVNAWNAENRHGRLYLDEEDMLVFEMDLDTFHGVSVQTIEQFFRKYQSQLETFGEGE